MTVIVYFAAKAALFAVVLSVVAFGLTVLVLSASRRRGRPLE